MATRRINPQFRSEATTKVVAVPVSTVVDPGNAGMPAAPVADTPPVQPNLQEARDLQALSQAFGQLSSSLGQAFSAYQERQLGQARIDFAVRKDEADAVTKAEADKDKTARQAREAITEAEWVARKLANVSPNDFNKAYAELLSLGALVHVEEPAFQHTLAGLLGDAAAVEQNKIDRDRFNQLRELDSDELLDTNYVSRQHSEDLSGVDSRIPSFIPKEYQPRFTGAYLNKRKGTLADLTREHSVHIGKEVKAKSFDAIQNLVVDSLETSAANRTVPTMRVKITPGEGEQLLVSSALEDQDKSFEDQVADATAALEEEIEKARGSNLLTDREVRQAVASSLINRVLQAKSSADKKLARGVLYAIETGPKDSRLKLTEDDALQNAVRSKEADMEASILQAETRETAAAEKAEKDRLRNLEKVQKQAFINATEQQRDIITYLFTQDVLKSDQIGSVDESVQALTQRLRSADPSKPAGDTALDMFVYTFVKNYGNNFEITGDKVTVYNADRTLSEEIDLTSLAKEAVNLSGQQFHKITFQALINQGLSESRAESVAHAMTYATQGGLSPSKGILSGAAREAAIRLDPDSESSMARFLDIYAAYVQLDKYEGSGPKINDVFGKGSVYSVFDQYRRTPNSPDNEADALRLFSDLVRSGMLSEGTLQSFYEVHKENIETAVTKAGDANGIPVGSRGDLRQRVLMTAVLSGKAGYTETINLANQLARYKVRQEATVIEQTDYASFGASLVRETAFGAFSIKTPVILGDNLDVSVDDIDAIKRIIKDSQLGMLQPTARSENAVTTSASGHGRVYFKNPEEAKPLLEEVRRLLGKTGVEFWESGALPHFQPVKETPESELRFILMAPKILGGVLYGSSQVYRTGDVQTFSMKEVEALRAFTLQTEVQSGLVEPFGGG